MSTAIQPFSRVFVKKCCCAEQRPSFSSSFSRRLSCGRRGTTSSCPTCRPPKARQASAIRSPCSPDRLQAGQATLTFGEKGGLLASVLRELKMPVSSQVLVFSKTSLQHEDITPRTPRAIYFNDNVYLGFVPNGDRLELSAVDPAIGAVFYTLSQRAGARPSLVTDATCLQCHAVPATLGVAGHVLRSVFVRSDGRLVSEARSYLTDHRSPMEERWGGWFVSGTLSGNTAHGERAAPAGTERPRRSIAPPARTSPACRRSSTATCIPSPHSDVVALMVLAHQVRMHNLIARLHYDATPGLHDCRRGTAAAARRRRRGARALSAVRRRGAAQRAGLRPDDICQGLRTARTEGRAGPIAPPVRSAITPLPLSLQLPRLFGGVSGAAEERQRTASMPGWPRCSRAGIRARRFPVCSPSIALPSWRF